MPQPSIFKKGLIFSILLIIATPSIASASPAEGHLSHPPRVSDIGEPASNDNFSVKYENDVIIIDDKLGPKTKLIVHGENISAVSIRTAENKTGTPYISPDLLAGVFNGTVDGGGITVSVPDDGELNVNNTQNFACEVELGKYEFMIEDKGSGVDDTASLSLESDLIPDAEFLRKPFNVTKGQTVEIPLRVDDQPICWDINDVKIEIESPSGAKINARINKNSSDQIIRFNFNTNYDGDRTLSKMLSAKDPDQVTDIHPISSQNSFRTQPGKYTFSLISEYGVEAQTSVFIEENKSSRSIKPTQTVDRKDSANNSSTPGQNQSQSTDLIDSKTSHTSAEGNGFGLMIAMLALFIVFIIQLCAAEYLSQ